MEKSSQGLCRECGKPLPPGRSDMQFCSVECKNRWHNRRGSRYRSCRLRTLNALEKNHRILEELLEADLRSKDLMDLLLLGFTPEYCSSCRRVKGHLEYVCYDIRYYLSSVRVWGIGRIEGIKPLSAVSGDP